MNSCIPAYSCPEASNRRRDSEPKIADADLHAAGRTEELAPGEGLAIGGMQVTTAARTAFDLGRHTPQRVQAVQRLDALVNATGVKLVDVDSVAAAHPVLRNCAGTASV